MEIRSYSYPRAALIGNPSDGYFGKTIAFVFRNYRAEASLSPSDQVRFIPGQRDRSQFANLAEFETELDQFGYYGGMRLMKASVKVFLNYFKSQNQPLPDRTFSLSYQSNIPNRLGMAGSSAIITAIFKCLQEWFGVTLRPEIQANLVLSVERDELGIGAGLQDRVAQAFEVPVRMDFEQRHLLKKGTGLYEPFDTSLLPPLYIAFDTRAASGSEKVHNDLKQRYAQNDPAVIAAMKSFRKLTDDFYAALQSGNRSEQNRLINRNFDLRASICQISQPDREMIDLARSLGLSAKFTGSGGTIIGICEGEEKFAELESVFGKNGMRVIRPEL